MLEQVVSKRHLLLFYFGKLKYWKSMHTIWYFLQPFHFHVHKIQLLLKSPFETFFWVLTHPQSNIKARFCVHVVALSKRFSSQKAGRPDRLYGTSYPNEHTFKKRGGNESDFSSTLLSFAMLFMTLKADMMSNNLVIYFRGVGGYRQSA